MNTGTNKPTGTEETNEFLLKFGGGARDMKDEPAVIVEADDFRGVVRTLKAALNPQVKFSDDFAAMQRQALEMQHGEIQHTLFLLKEINPGLFSQVEGE